MTEKARYAFFHRIDVRGWLIAVALGCVWLSADAANRNNIGRASQTSNGRSTSIGPVTNSTGSTIPISPTVGGWTQAGNYGVPPGASGTTMNLGAKGEAYISGTKYPFQAGYQKPWSEYVLPALGAAATVGCTLASGGLATAACFAIPLTLPYLYDWITKAGGRINPETGALERNNSSDPGFCDGVTVSTCYKWSWNNPPAGPAVVGTSTNPHIACESARPHWEAWLGAGRFSGSWTAVDAAPSNPGAAYSCWGVLDGVYKSIYNLIRGDVRPPDSTTWYPSSMDDIAPYMQKVNPDPRVWGEVIEKGAEMPLPNPTVTGPSQIQGPERTTTNPDGSRTVERTTHNYSNTGNTITNISNVTTTTTYNTDNSVRSTSSTTETPTEEEADKEDACEKRPNTIGCADMDTPTGEIPRETKTITYVEESVFGGGSCPSDKQWSSGTTGGSYKVIDWQTFCGYALPARFLVILLATFAAFLIVMPGKEVRT